MQRVVICGAGFGGLELASRLSGSLADEVEIILIERSDSFVFGFSKFDVMFGKKTLDEVRLDYDDMHLPGVDFRRETITSIDAGNRTVETDRGSYHADLLVVALGATYDVDATPGLREHGHEFYSLEGARQTGEVLPSFTSGRAIVGVLGTPFKCPPAPFECALLLHDYLTERGHRDAVQIEVISPLDSPIPVSKDVSGAIVGALDERGIASTFNDRVTELGAGTATLAGGGTISFDLFFAIPVHRAPEVVAQSGMCVDGWIPVDQTNLRTRFDGVYAIGDVASAPVPRAGVFAETAARAVFDDIASRLRGTSFDTPYDGSGQCYIEFGGGLVAKVDANFLGGPQPRADLVGPSPQITQEKAQFAPTRRKRWFGA